MRISNCDGEFSAVSGCGSLSVRNQASPNERQARHDPDTPSPTALYEHESSSFFFSRLTLPRKRCTVWNRWYLYIWQATLQWLRRGPVGHWAAASRWVELLAKGVPRPTHGLAVSWYPAGQISLHKG